MMNRKPGDVVYAEPGKNIYDALRVQIAARKDFSLGIGTVLVCPVCSKPIKYGFDMHEVLITRGMVMKSPNRDFIFHRCNCVARHHVCGPKLYHQPGNDSEEVYRKLAEYLIRHEGYVNILEWFVSLEAQFKSDVIEDARRKFVTLAHPQY